MLTQIKAWLIAGFGLLLGGLAIFASSMKGQRDRAKRKADTLSAQAHAERQALKIYKEEKVKLASRRAEIHNQIKEKKEGKKFEGIDSLSNPNDDWS